MISLNRSDSLTLQDQLVEQIRYLVASGRYRTGETLPSTRALASQLGISFHTVRKAYARLADEGLVEPVRGSGYRVLEREPRPRSDRLEQGAAVLQTALRSLVGLGLTESEMAYVFEEQMDLLSPKEEDPGLLFAAEYVEAAEHGAGLLQAKLGQKVEGVPIARMSEASDAEYIVAPFPLVRKVMERAPRADVFGLHVTLPAEASAAAARLYDHQTMLLVVRYPDAIGPLSRLIKSESGFTGQIIAMAVEEGDTRLGGLVRQSDLLLYTSAARRSIRAHLGSAAMHRPIDVSIAQSEIDRLRDELPD